MLKRRSFYIVVFIFMMSITLSSCHYVKRYSYIEGSKIERDNYTLEYVSIDYKEEIAVINLKITKKNDNEVTIKSAVARSYGGGYIENPKEVYFNDTLQENVENILIKSVTTDIKLIYPIEVKNGSFELVISNDSFDMWIQTKEYLFGTTTTTQAS